MEIHFVKSKRLTKGVSNARPCYVQTASHCISLHGPCVSRRDREAMYWFPLQDCDNM